jgi:hypothetical protein
MQQIIEGLAREIGISASAIQNWRRVGRVAHRHRLALVEAGRALKLTLTTEDFEGFRTVGPGGRKAAHRVDPAAEVCAETAERVDEPKMTDGYSLSSAAA